MEINKAKTIALSYILVSWLVVEKLCADHTQEKKERHYLWLTWNHTIKLELSQSNINESGNKDVQK